MNLLYSSLPYFVILVALTGCYGDPPTRSWIQADYGLYDAAVSEGGRFAVVATVDHAALVWDLPNNKLLHTWRHQEGEANEIIHTAISPEGRVALTAEKQIFALWAVNSGQTVRYWQMPADIQAIRLSSGGRFALTGLADATARYIDLKTGATTQVFNHDGAVQAVAISADNRFALTGSEDWQAKLWRIENGELLRTLPHKFTVNTVALSSQSRYAFTAAGQFEAYIWDLRSGKVKHPLLLRGATLHKVRTANMTVDTAIFSKDETKLYTSSPPSFVRQWDVATGKLMKQWVVPKRTFWKPPGGVIYALALSQDGRFLIANSADGTAHAWSLTEP